MTQQQMDQFIGLDARTRSDAPLTADNPAINRVRKWFDRGLNRHDCFWMLVLNEGVDPQEAETEVDKW